MTSIIIQPIFDCTQAWLINDKYIFGVQ